MFQLNRFSYNFSIISVFLFDLLFFVFLVDGKFSDWTSGACKTNKGDTCGVGKKGTLKRTRTCTSPKPQYGGKDCEGENETIEECTLEPCPRNIAQYEICFFIENNLNYKQVFKFFNLYFYIYSRLCEWRMPK